MQSSKQHCWEMTSSPPLLSPATGPQMPRRTPANNSSSSSSSRHRGIMAQAAAAAVLYPRQQGRSIPVVAAAAAAAAGDTEGDTHPAVYGAVGGSLGLCIDSCAHVEFRLQAWECPAAQCTSGRCICHEAAAGMYPVLVPVEHGCVGCMARCCCTEHAVERHASVCGLHPWDGAMSKGLVKIQSVYIDKCGGGGGHTCGVGTGVGQTEGSALTLAAGPHCLCSSSRSRVFGVFTCRWSAASWLLPSVAVMCTAAPWHVCPLVYILMCCQCGMYRACSCLQVVVHLTTHLVPFG
jgi:hypothetical protein